MHGASYPASRTAQDLRVTRLYGSDYCWTPIDDGDRRPGGDLLREEQVLAVDGVGVAVPEPALDATTADIHSPWR